MEATSDNAQMSGIVSMLWGVCVCGGDALGSETREESQKEREREIEREREAWRSTTQISGLHGSRGAKWIVSFEAIIFPHKRADSFGGLQSCCRMFTRPSHMTSEDMCETRMTTMCCVLRLGRSRTTTMA